MGNIFQVPQWVPEISEALYTFFFFFLTIHTFTLKGSSLQILSGTPNCQHRYCCTLGPFLSRIKVIECKQCDTTTVSLVTESATRLGSVYTVDMLDKTMIQVIVGWSEMAQDEISLHYSEQCMI